jgi:KaiC/GvpD/RAD55 family RecA-like ATPase
MGPTLLCHHCGGAVDVPQKGWKRGEAAYCSTHWVLVGKDPWVRGQEAIDSAEAFHELPTEDLVSWPWRSVNELAGPLVPGRLTYIAAFPGGGKTTFLTHCLHYWLGQGKKVTYLPLESDPAEVFTRLACLELGISADDALSKRLRQQADVGDLEAERKLDDLKVMFRLMRDRREMLESLRVEPLEALTPAAFREVIMTARVMASDLIVVDHVDHAEADEHAPKAEISVSNEVQMDALRAAKKLHIPVVLATQLNSSRTGNDRMAHYKPPVVDWLYNKGKKEQLAANILGLSRLIKASANAEMLAEVRAGTRPVEDVVLDHTMGVTGMKLRYGGGMKEKTVKLRYEHGKITDMPSMDAREIAAAEHGILLGSPSQRRVA